MNTTHVGIFDLVTQMFIMVIPIEDIENYRKYLNRSEYILFKLEKYE